MLCILHIKDGACEHIFRMAVERRRTLYLCYELDGPKSIDVGYYRSTIVGKLIDYMQAMLGSSDGIAFFYGDVQMDATKTMGEYNIREDTDAYITVKTVYTHPPASPSPSPEPEPGAKRKREDSASKAPV